MEETNKNIYFRCGELEKKIEELQEQGNKLKNELVEANKEKETLSEKNNEFYEQIEKIKTAEKTDLEEQKETLSEKNNEFYEQIEKLKQQKTDLEEQKARVCGEILPPDY